MDDRQFSNTSQHMTIQLEVLPKDGQQPDISDIDEVSRSIVNQIKENGCVVEPSYTGSKGSPIFDLIVQLYTVVHENQDLLAAIFASITLALRGIVKERERRAAKEKEQRDPLEIVVQVNDKPLKIRTPDVESAVKLLELFQSTYPEEMKKVTTKSRVSIQVRVPNKKRRRKH